MQITLKNGQTAEAAVMVDLYGQPLLIGGQNVVQLTSPANGDTVAMTDDNVDGTLFLTPSTSVKASVLFTVANTFNAAAGEEVIIGANVYTFAAVPVLPYDVKIGATETITATNLAAAVNVSAGSGTIYGTGTAIHPLVTATDHLDGTVTFTAKTPGTAGNSIQSVENGAHLSFASVTLTGGTDTSGTIAAATVTLPSDANSRIGQIRRLSTSQIITALTVNGATTIFNNITTLALGKTATFQKVAADTWTSF